MPPFHRQSSYARTKSSNKLACPLLAQSGHELVHRTCPLLTQCGHRASQASDCGLQLHQRVIPLTHSVRLKSNEPSQCDKINGGDDETNRTPCRSRCLLHTGTAPLGRRSDHTCNPSIDHNAGQSRSHDSVRLISRTAHPARRRWRRFTTI